jgi:hypothetical protein
MERHHMENPDDGTETHHIMIENPDDGTERHHWEIQMMAQKDITWKI